MCSVKRNILLEEVLYFVERGVSLRQKSQKLNGNIIILLPWEFFKKCDESKSVNRKLPRSKSAQHP